MPRIYVSPVPSRIVALSVRRSGRGSIARWLAIHHPQIRMRFQPTAQVPFPTDAVHNKPFAAPIGLLGWQPPPAIDRPNAFATG
jgi:hypothetical protein